ncbi:MAG TPA: TonB-dependent receptor [Acidobacteriaceae bacterium]|nr:TonB-dependent receptor [Acidobacteriaceae bacterium]
MIRTHLHKFALFCIAAIAATGMGLAQSSTQGAISGTVEDATSAVVPNAKVVIRNDGTNAEKVLTSDASGYFNAPLIEPGVYTVTVTAASFGTVTETHVTVQVGQLTTVMPRLSAGSEEQKVTVSADAATLNFQSPDFSAEVPRAAVDNVPVQNRRWSALAMTTPAVVADSSGFGLVSVRGMSTLLNNVQIDGADDNQAYFSEERGRTREGYSTSSNAVSEFEVNTGVYSAQYGRAAGGVINSVTKSGTNTLHGELFFTDLDRGWGAYDPGSVSPTGAPLKPKDLRKIYGGTLGGPIVKNKLFWTYTYDQLDHVFPAIAKAKQYGSAATVGSFEEQPDAATPLIETNCNHATGYLNETTAGTGTLAHATLDNAVCTMVARLGQATYATGVANYNSGINALLTDLGIVPRVGFQEINTPKLDWQINPKEHLSFLFHRLRWDAPGDVQTASSATYSVDAFGTDFIKLDYGVTKLTSQISSKLVNEVLYQYSRELDDEGQQPYSAYTLANLVAPGQTVTGAAPNGPGGTIPYIGLDTSIGFNLGSPYYSYRLAYPEEWKWQADDILYYTTGNHSIRMGFDLLHNYDLLHQTPYYYGDYTYGTLPNYLTDLATKGKTGTCNTTGAAGTATTSGVGTTDCYSSAFQDFGATQYAIATTDYAGFLQDNWKVNPRLTLELGVRYDYESLPAPTAGLTSTVGTFVPYAGLTNAPADKNNFGPRIGFSFDAFGDGSTVVRGGYGLYYGRILNGTVASVQFGSGSPNGQYGLASTKPTAAGAPIFPNPFAAGSGSKPSSFYLAPNLQNPQVHEFDLQIQRQLGKGNVFEIGYLGSVGRELPNFLDVNLAPPQDVTTITVGNPTVAGSGTGPLAIGTKYQVPTFGTCTASASCAYPTGYINPNFTNITEVVSNINSNYHALIVDIQNRSIHGLEFDANYTWSHALDFNQNASSTTSTNSWLNPYAAARQNYGISQFNVGNRFVGYALYKIPNMHSSNMLKYLTDGWSINDTFQIQNGLPYSANLSTSGAGYNSTQALNSGTWNGITGATYIPAIGLNTFEVPRAIVDDLRLQKEFTIAEKYQLQLNADMYNVANKQNFSTSDLSTTAYNYTSSTSGASTASYVPNSAPGIGFGSHSTSNDSGFLYTPREFQIGARLEF